MATTQALLPSRDFRLELVKRGGDSAARCYQCATCSTACDLAGVDVNFPRQQMVRAQWGLVDDLAGDSGVWLCHNCNDCSTRCPRDARPGDVLQAVRSIITERLAVPTFMGKLVGHAGTTWPLLLGLPILLWTAVLFGVNGLQVPAAPLAYHDFVPHWLIYAVYFSISGWVVVSSGISGSRYWAMMGAQEKRQGGFVSNLIPALIDVVTHRRFGECGEQKPRRLGHLALFYGFVGAAVTSGLLVIGMYGMGMTLPIEQVHPFKILGNISAVLLVIGAGWLMVRRWFTEEAQRSTAFDNFFLAVVVLLVITGVLTEAGRLFLDPGVAVTVYVLHLGVVTTLFLTFPYSKFAHMLYRVLAMVHDRMKVQGTA